MSNPTIYEFSKKVFDNIDDTTIEMERSLRADLKSFQGIDQEGRR